MATPTRLSGPAQMANAAATVYTAPANGALIRVIHISNPGTVARNVTISIGADAAATRIFDAFTISPGTVYPFPCYIALTSAQIVQAFASAAASVVLMLEGDVGII